MIYDVPCIKNSPLVKQIGIENVDEIAKKKNFYHIMTDFDDKIIIENENDLHDVLECLDFHMVNDLPYEILDYVAKNTTVSLEKFKNTLYYKTLNFIKEMTCIYNNKSDSFWAVFKSIDKNGLLSVRWEDSRYITFDKYIIKYLCDRYYTYKFYDFKECYCMHYILKNNLEMLKFAEDEIEQEDCRHWFVDCVSNHNYKWHEHIDDPCQYPAANGNLEMMKYIYSLCKRWDNKTIIAAAEYGNLHCLKYAIENGCRYDNGAIANQAANYACKNGHLNCLKYIIEKDGVVIVDECKKYAQENNQTHILDFINKYWNEDEYKFNIKR